MINGKLANISKVKDTEVKITSVNIHGHKSVKIVKDLKFTYKEDLVLEYLVPK